MPEIENLTPEGANFLQEFMVSSLEDFSKEGKPSLYQPLNAIKLFYKVKWLSKKGYEPILLGKFKEAGYYDDEAENL